MRENGELTGRKMWGQQSCMGEWWWIPLQTILHLITFTPRNKNKMQMHGFDFPRRMISPTFQVGSYVDWLFLTPQRAARTQTTFDFLELRRWSLRQHRVLWRWRGAWWLRGKKHTIHKLQQNSQKHSFFFFFTYFMNFGCNVWGQSSAPPTERDVITWHNLFTARRVRFTWTDLPQFSTWLWLQLKNAGFYLVSVYFEVLRGKQDKVLIWGRKHLFFFKNVI